MPGGFAVPGARPGGHGAVTGLTLALTSGLARLSPGPVPGPVLPFQPRCCGRRGPEPGQGCPRGRDSPAAWAAPGTAAQGSPRCSQAVPGASRPLPARCLRVPPPRCLCQDFSHPGQVQPGLGTPGRAEPARSWELGCSLGMGSSLGSPELPLSIPPLPSLVTVPPLPSSCRCSTTVPT